MSEFKHILAVIDPSMSQQKSLDRAVELAEKSGASIMAFLCIYDFSYEMTTMLSSEAREQVRHALLDDKVGWLNDVINQYDSKGAVTMEIRVVWHNRPYEAIIQEVMGKGHDLIVKGTQDHDTLQSVIFTPTDWHLLRKAPVSVLLVKEHDWPDDGQILAAVNVGCEDDSHISLNNRITQSAKNMADLLHANVHLVNSYPGTPANVLMEVPDFDPTTYNESVKQHHLNSMRDHAKEYAIQDSACHIREGLPEDVIPQLAKELDAELVIIGTIGRQGISAALIGNTAEHVIDMLDCDVLALKPEGFVTPVKRKE